MNTTLSELQNISRQLEGDMNQENPENNCQKEASEYAEVVENIRTGAEKLTASQENPVQLPKQKEREDADILEKIGLSQAEINAVILTILQYANQDLSEQNVRNIGQIIKCVQNYKKELQSAIYDLNCAEEDIELGRITEDRKDQHWKDKKEHYAQETERVGEKFLEDITPCIEKQMLSFY